MKHMNWFIRLHYLEYRTSLSIKNFWKTRLIFVYPLNHFLTMKLWLCFQGF